MLLSVEAAVPTADQDTNRRYACRYSGGIAIADRDLLGRKRGSVGQKAPLEN